MTDQARTGLLDRLRSQLERREVLVASLSLLVACLIAWSVARFVGLRSSPLGFSEIEASRSLHVACLSQTGRDADGHAFPLFVAGREAEHANAVWASPVYLYSGVVWTKIFGASIQSERSLSALLSLAVVAGAGALGLCLGGAAAGFGAALAAASSHFLFQCCRSVNELPMALALLVWGAWLVVSSVTHRRALAGAVALGAAAWTAPFLSAQVLLSLPLLLRLKGCSEAGRAVRVVGVVGAACLVLALALWFKATGVFDDAWNASVFSSAFLDGLDSRFERLIAYGGRVPVVVTAAFDNLWAYFNPRFLFYSGDANARVSIQDFGELGWPEMAVFGSALFVALTRLCRGQRLFDPGSLSGPRAPIASIGRQSAVLAGLVACALIPAALFGRMNPSAERVAGAWPFLSILVGVLGARLIERRRALAPALALLCAAYGAAFLSTALFSYPRWSSGAWDESIRGAFEAASQSGDWRLLSNLPPDTPRFTARYFFMEYGGESCASSAARAERLFAAKP